MRAVGLVAVLSVAVVPATGTMYYVKVGTRPRKVGFARVGADLVTVTMGGAG